MSQLNPPAGPHGQTNVYITPQPSNGLGVAGFITSLIGIFSCGLLAPIGLILSFFAMFKRPHGFAVAGLVLGLFGSVFLVFLIFGGLMMVLAAVGLGREAQNLHSAYQASVMIEQSKKETGLLPNDSTGTSLISRQLDIWQNSFRYKKTGDDSYQIISSGRDGEFETEDDSSYESSTLRTNPLDFDSTTSPFAKPDNPPAHIPTH